EQHQRQQARAHASPRERVLLGRFSSPRLGTATRPREAHLHLREGAPRGFPYHGTRTLAGERERTFDFACESAHSPACGTRQAVSPWPSAFAATGGWVALDPVLPDERLPSSLRAPRGLLGLLS